VCIYIDMYLYVCVCVCVYIYNHSPGPTTQLASQFFIKEMVMEIIRPSSRPLFWHFSDLIEQRRQCKYIYPRLCKHDGKHNLIKVNTAIISWEMFICTRVCVCVCVKYNAPPAIGQQREVCCHGNREKRAFQGHRPSRESK